jgi:Fe-S oxidoreductase
MLGMARRRLHRSLETLREEIDAGVPVVGLEPSCVSVFRDELVSMLPESAAARQLARSTFLLGEFLRREHRREPLPLPELHARALVHGHCHHKSVIDPHLEKEPELLDAIGLDHEILAGAGCCGMAGSFGYEPGEKYEVSMAAGERLLLPRVREASKSTLIVADGFSCREQVMQTTDRQPLHTAQVLQLAREAGPAAPEREYPERGLVTGSIGGPTRRRVIGTAIALGGMAGAVAAALLAWRRVPR